MCLICKGLPWDYGVDIFAAASIFFELLTGKPLLQHANSDAERLASMEGVLSFFPHNLIELVGYSARDVFFYNAGVWRVRFPRACQFLDYTPVELERAFSRLLQTRYYKVPSYSFLRDRLAEIFLFFLV